MGFAALAAVWALSLGSPASANASCIVNGGSGPNALNFSFNSTGNGGGYGLNELAPGQRQCFFAHGWSGGYVAISGGFTDLAAPRYFGGIDVPEHGLISASAINNPSAATNELCSYYVPAGNATYSNPGGSPPSGSNGDDLAGGGTGSNCFNVNIDAE